jgi:hypothetical protein
MTTKNRDSQSAGVDSSDLLASEELLALKLKVKEFCIQFDKNELGMGWGLWNATPR